MDPKTFKMVKNGQLAHLFKSKIDQKKGSKNRTKIGPKNGSKNWPKIRLKKRSKK